jgi:hypothetical protein
LSRLMFLSSKGTPMRERNSFTPWHGPHKLPLYTTTGGFSSSCALIAAS